MANLSWKDISGVTFNSVDLKVWVRTISGLSEESVLASFRAAGSVYPTVRDTGMSTHDPIVVEFEYDGAAGGPNVTCARGTAAALTVTLATGQSITGTCLVSRRELSIGAEDEDTLTVTFTPSTANGMVWDLAV